MIRPQFSLDLHSEIIVDNFAGGGGASTGIEMALGRHVDHAINHNAEALGMHRINHPQTVHHCEDVFDVDPTNIAQGRRVGLGWFSPDCRHFSKAKGGKPLSKKIRGLAFVILRWASIRTRVIVMENVEEIQTWGPLLHHARHAEDCACAKPCGRPDPDNKGRTWKAFLAALGDGIDHDHPDIPEMLEVLGDTVTREQLISGFGYKIETSELRACDYGTRTIRKRLFMIARCDGKPIKWPAQTHAAPARVKGSGLKPWRPVSECIDWTRPCHSIFLTKDQARLVKCKRPLAKSTLRRVAAGIDRYVLKSPKPFIISLTHHGGDRIESIDDPAKTITGAHRGEKAIVTPFLTEHANASTERTFNPEEPLRTQCSEVKGGHFALVSSSLLQTGHMKSTTCASQDLALVSATLIGAGGPTRTGEPRPVDKPFHSILADNNTQLVAASMVKLRGDPETHAPGHPVDEPGHTSSAGGQHHAVSCAYLAQHNGGFNTTPGHGAGEPLGTISGTGSQQQIVSASLTAYYGSETEGQGVHEPLRTVTTKERFGLTTSEAVTPAMTEEQRQGALRVARFLRAHGVQFEGEYATVGQYVIIDIGMRMLCPRELFRAQGFPDSYTIDRAWLVDPKTGEIKEVRLTKEAQIRMVGNSVCPDVAAAIVASNVPELSVWADKERRKFNRQAQRVYA